MDPFLLCDIVQRLTASSLSTTKLLHNIQTKSKDAPLAIADIRHYTTFMTGSLACVQTMLCLHVERIQLVVSEPEVAHATDALLTGCTVILSCLDDELRNVTDGQPHINAMTGKAEVGWNLDRLQELLNAVRRCKRSLKVLMQIVSLESTEEMTHMLKENKTILSTSIKTTNSMKESHPRLYFPPSIYSEHDRPSFHPNSLIEKEILPLALIYDEMVINGKTYRRVPENNTSDTNVNKTKKKPTNKGTKPAQNTTKKATGDPSADQALADKLYNEFYPRQKAALQEIWTGKDSPAAIQTPNRPPNPVNLDCELTTTKKEASHYKHIGEYILGEFLGRTADSKIRLGWKHRSSTRYAIKQIIRDRFSRYLDEPLAESWTEISILSDIGHNFPHPNIIAFHEIVMTSASFAMVFTNFESGNLYTLMRNSAKGLTEKVARSYFSQLLSGLEHIHDKGIVHRNLNLTNLLVSDDGEGIVITGFDEAKRIQTDAVLGPLDERIYYGLTDKQDPVLEKGSKFKVGEADLIEANYRCETYGAAEILVSEAYGGRKADLWSCGVILFAMLAGAWPKDDPVDNPQHVNVLLEKWINNEEEELGFPASVAGPAANLIKRLLTPLPWRRMALWAVQEHIWLQ